MPSTANQDTTEGRNRWWHLTRGISATDKLFLVQNLQVMVRTGLSVSRALGTLAAQTRSPGLRATLQGMAREVESGQSLTQTMGSRPQAFSNLFVSLVRAGELSGKLEDSLAQLFRQLKKDHELVAKVRGALAYPLVVLAAMIGLGIAMVVFVVPQITSIFQEVHLELPLPTRLLIGLSDLVSRHGLPIAAGTVLALTGLVLLLRSSWGRPHWHWLLLRLPVFGNILREVNLARFTRTLSSLLKTDIPIVEAFSIAAMTHANLHYRRALQAAAEQLSRGRSVAQALGERVDLFSPLVVQMVAVGEEAGALDDLLRELAEFYEEKVSQTLASLSSIIEPILMLVMGAAVGGMAVAIVQPMFKLTEQF